MGVGERALVATGSNAFAWFCGDVGNEEAAITGSDTRKVLRRKPGRPLAGFRLPLLLLLLLVVGASEKDMMNMWKCNLCNRYNSTQPTPNCPPVRAHDWPYAKRPESDLVVCRLPFSRSTGGVDESRMTLLCRIENSHHSSICATPGREIVYKTMRRKGKNPNHELQKKT
jgi:hypothetical protein